MQLSAHVAPVERESGQAILAAAYRLLVEQGFGAMSMRGLGSCVGIQPGSLYHHFTGKQEVLEEVLHGLLEQRLQAWRSVKPRKAPLLARLEAFIAFHVTYTLGHPHDGPMLRSERRHLEPGRRDRLDRLEARYTRELLELVAEGVASGLFRVTDAELAACSLFALFSSAEVIAGKALATDRAEVTCWMTELAMRVLQVDEGTKSRWRHA